MPIYMITDYKHFLVANINQDKLKTGYIQQQHFTLGNYEGLGLVQAESWRMGFSQNGTTWQRVHLIHSPVFLDSQCPQITKQFIRRN